MNSQTPAIQADLIILGGGCAGLSLATRLAIEAPSLHVLIVEPRLTYEEDRTWCGWRVQSHLFEDCAVAEWPQWRVVASSRTIQRGSDAYPYEMIRSDLFYAKALAAIARSSTCSMLQGVSAETCTPFEANVEVALSDGSTAVAPWVIDTRPQHRTLHSPWLWQHFLGFVLEFEPTESAFHHIPTLMDFQPEGACVAQFMYVLPIREREFLCEWTQFSRTECMPPELEANLLNWLNRHALPGWKLKRKESGSLPMAVAPASRQGRVIQAGTRGGSMRASSGYAFHAIQRWSESCAASLRTTGVPTAPERSRLLEVMDTLFLQVLQQRSCSAASLFGALFQNCPSDSLVRFLAGLPRTADLWPVVRSLPWTRFLRAGPAAAYNWGRR